MPGTEDTVSRYTVQIRVAVTPEMDARIRALVHNPRDKSRVVREMLELGLAVYARGEEARQRALADRPH